MSKIKELKWRCIGILNWVIQNDKEIIAEAGTKFIDSYVNSIGLMILKLRENEREIERRRHKTTGTNNGSRANSDK